MGRCQTCHRRLGSDLECPVHGRGANSVGAGAAWDVRPPVAELRGRPLGRELGAGGFASIWQLGDDRVVKIAHVSHKLARARIAREAEALAAVGAPAVPALHGVGALADGRSWLIMDRIHGRTLADIATTGPQDVGTAVAIGVGILDALARIHAAGFVHRDIKPDNLMRTPDGKIVILDLGLARKLPHDPGDPTRENVQVGSLEYMPPEQIADSASVDERSDLYAFGCVLYELIAGRPPFVGDAAALQRAHAALRAPRLGGLVENVPVAIEALCHDCLAKERARRPSNAATTRARLTNAVYHSDNRRSSPDISMIRESKQPVVLLWVELPRIDRALLALFTARRLIVASQRGRRIIAGAVGGDHGDPAGTAIAAARELVAAGARVALHLEALRIGSSEAGRTLAGEAIENPSGWVPSGAWTGVLMSRAFAAAARVQTRACEASPEFLTFGDLQERPLLLGRDALLSELAADAQAALGGEGRPASGPAFAMLVGDAGVGKTAFALELGQRLAADGVAVHVVTIATPGAGKPAHASLTQAIPLPPEARGPIVRTIGDALRAAARSRPTAIILDDLHLADHELYDALEYATLGGEALPLWILGVASRRIDAKRPNLGLRAERHRKDVLPPLDEAAAIDLAATLLRPAEYPPLHALRKLAGMARGNPLHLWMLAREIHERGAIRSRSDGSPFLDTTALEELSAAALAPWLAARELASLAPELIALARICAVLAGEFAVGRDEVDAIVEAVERGGGATTTIDVEVGLRELEATGILAVSQQGFQFCQPLVEEGIYATTDEQERLAIHNAALTYWLAASGIAASEHVARHADSVGACQVAARAFAALGDRALAEYRAFDADVAWSGALRQLGEPTVERARALLGRGRARYRMQRLKEAVSDLEQAVTLAAELGNIRLEVEALLVQATAVDFMEGMSEDFVRTNDFVLRAHTRYRDAQANWLDIELDLQLADARKLYRAQEFDTIIPLLRRLQRRAKARHNHDVATSAALVLGCALADRRLLEESERVFADVISDCSSRGDQFHLAAAYVNRAWLWSAIGDNVQIERELELVIQLTREGGLAFLERAATHNLAEHKLWHRQYDDAIRLARRSLALQSTVTEGPTMPDRLLLARTLAGCGRLDELGNVLAAMTSTDGLMQQALIALGVLRALASRDRDALCAAAASLDQVPFVQLRLELGALAIARGAVEEPLRRQLEEVAKADPVWRLRIDEFGPIRGS